MNELHYVPTEEEMEAAENEALTEHAIKEFEEEIEVRLGLMDMFLEHFAYDLAEAEFSKVENLRWRIEALQG